MECIWKDLLKLTSFTIFEKFIQDIISACFDTGFVYNVSPYMEYHPGGEDELMRAAGSDGTELFDQVRCAESNQSIPVEEYSQIYQCDICRKKENSCINPRCIGLNFEVWEDAHKQQLFI